MWIERDSPIDVFECFSSSAGPNQTVPEIGLSISITGLKAFAVFGGRYGGIEFTLREMSEAERGAGPAESVVNLDALPGELDGPVDLRFRIVPMTEECAPGEHGGKAGISTSEFGIDIDHALVYIASTGNPLLDWRVWDRLGTDV